MGELEEAIREHLELKRRRGADPVEVAREEQEALAPVTRSHPVVVAVAPSEHADAEESAVDRRHRDSEDHGEEADLASQDVPDDATQEFRVQLDDWLDADEDG